MGKTSIFCVWFSVTVVCLVFLPDIQQVTAESDVPLSKFNQNMGKPTLKFLYW